MMLTRIEHNPKGQLVRVFDCQRWEYVQELNTRRTWGRRPAGFRLPTVLEGSRQRSQRRFWPAYGKPLRESNREFNGTDGLRTYIRIVPLSLRQALLARPQRLPPVAGAGRPIARAQPIGDAIDL